MQRNPFRGDTNDAVSATPKGVFIKNDIDLIL